MNRRSLGGSLLLVLLLCGQPAPRATNELRAVVGGDGSRIEVTAKLLKTDAGFPFRAGWLWGSEDTAPASVISELAVMVDGTHLFVPLSAFVDLGDPRTIKVDRGDQQFTVVIKGGDAAASYTATLTFSDSKVLMRRRVEHGEFPEQAWEETRYTFNTDAN